MFKILIFAFFALSIGLIIGKALKPWKAKLFPEESIIVYFVLWALLWPAMLFHVVIKGILASHSALKSRLDKN